MESLKLNLDLFLKFCGVIFVLQFLGGLEVLKNSIPAVIQIMLK